jgi:hypothetical protein
MLIIPLNVSIHLLSGLLMWSTSKLHPQTTPYMKKLLFPPRYKIEYFPERFCATLVPNLADYIA